MRILLLAPHPFYQERGTPIAVDLLASTLAMRGEIVDILAYHEGHDRSYPSNVTIYRIKPPPFTKNIRPGFSLKKLICDIAMYRRAAALAKANHYDCIHAVEEAAFMARRIARQHNIPYIFDMDSSMPNQIIDKIALAKPLLPIMRRLEASVIRSAAMVVPMCEALAETARDGGAKKVKVLHDISLLPESHASCPENGFRQELGVAGQSLLYIGNLESYQGIDLMLESFAIASRKCTDATLVIVGGRPDDIAKYKDKRDQLKLTNRVFFTGPRPLSHMCYLFDDADILVSPRTLGKNTPMKIYSYLDSGRAIIATDLATHTQVMDKSMAMLTPPNTKDMANAMQKLLLDSDLRKKLAKKAKQHAQTNFSRAAFSKKIDDIYSYISNLHP
jgi:glycosyltransferase involved in cell wall biosynthesis